MANIGSKIRRLRQKQGWSQKQLAKISGLARISIAQIETGIRINPIVATRKKLAKALRVPITQLLD